jgi:hypothetical protein
MNEIELAAIPTSGRQRGGEVAFAGDAFGANRLRRRFHVRLKAN